MAYDRMYIANKTQEMALMIGRSGCTYVWEFGNADLLYQFFKDSYPGDEIFIAYESDKDFNEQEYEWLNKIDDNFTFKFYKDEE